VEEDVPDEAEQECCHLLPVERSPPYGKCDGQEKEPEQDQFQQRGDLATPEIDQSLGDLVANRGAKCPDSRFQFANVRQDRARWMCMR
jgi:hypothetical protein